MAEELGGPSALRLLEEGTPRRRRIAVIGGGLVGTATASAAARIGGGSVQVDLYEAATIGHEAGASIDQTRVFRHAYGEQAFYTRWTAEAATLWRDLEQRSERELLQPSAAVWVAHATATSATSTGLERPYDPAAATRLLEVSFAVMREAGLTCEMLNSYELRRRYPQFADPTIAKALLDKEAGVLLARDCVLALAAVSRLSGVTIHEGKRAVEVRSDAGSCGIRFADGTSIEADVAVLAVNGWLPSLLPGLADRMPAADTDNPECFSERGLQNTEQPLYYFAPPADAEDEFGPGRFPVFLFANARVYGLPAHRGAMKVANNDPSRLLDTPEERRLASQLYREQLYAFLVRQFPSLRRAALIQERVCFYDRSPDGDFVMDQWDADARVLVACGFSGHGFKFGPLLGARLARYALSGERPADLVPFRLSRFSAAGVSGA